MITAGSRAISAPPAYKCCLVFPVSIDATAGIPLTWCELPKKKASKIIIERSAELGDKSLWQEQFDWLIDAMEKMKKAFQTYL